jgi:hypothetical protein
MKRKTGFIHLKSRGTSVRTAFYLLFIILEFLFGERVF